MEKDSSECFGQYIRGEDVYQSSRRANVIEEKIRKALEMYQSLKSVITLTIFGSRCNRVHGLYDENFTYERSVYEAASNRQCWYCSRYIEPTVCFWWLSYNRSGLLKRAKQRKYFQFDHWSLQAQNSGKAYAPPRRQWETKLKVLLVRMSNPVPREEQKTVETKPKRNVRKKSFFGRLEEARNGARRGLPV